MAIGENVKVLGKLQVQACRNPQQQSAATKSEGEGERNLKEKPVPLSPHASLAMTLQACNAHVAQHFDSVGRTDLQAKDKSGGMYTASQPLTRAGS